MQGLPPQSTRLRAEPSTRWGRLRERFKAPRRLRFTREGKFFVGITFGVGFAAINTANNLLYLLLGMLLALIVVSGVMSELSLRGLTVVRRLPLRAQVGRPHLVEIEVFNRKNSHGWTPLRIADGVHRGMNLRASPETAAVLREAMTAAGVSTVVEPEENISGATK